MLINNEHYIVKSMGLLMLTMMLLFFAAGSSRAESFTPLEGDHPDAAADLAAQGTTVPTYQPLQMEVYLNPRNEAQLVQLLQDQQDPSSPQYHKFLTPDEYDQQFGPSDDDVAQVSNWLTSQGFTVTGGSAHDRRIAFTGDVATAQAAFPVHFAGSRDGTIYANVDDPQVPEELAPMISHLSGLDNRSVRSFVRLTRQLERYTDSIGRELNPTQERKSRHKFRIGVEAALPFPTPQHSRSHGYNDRPSWLRM